MQRLNERSTQRHLRALQTHLARENPILLDVVKSFRILDRVAHGLRLFERRDSLTAKVPWWPMIAMLGTFSAGKSTVASTVWPGIPDASAPGRPRRRKRRHGDGTIVSPRSAGVS